MTMNNNEHSNSNSNNITRSPSVVTNVYCILSALFFATCGYAQLNDPHPTMWVLAYLSGGVLPNLLLTSCPPNVIPLTVLRNTLLGFCATLLAVIVYKVATVIPKLEQHLDFFHFLEHEEGRDTCGLLLLVLHDLYLTTAFTTPRKKKRLSSSPRGSNGRQELFVESLVAVGSSTIVQSVVLIGILAGAAYLWVVHHPSMVAKYKVPHCQGGMFGRDGVAGEL
jgi:hypothetical protein